MLSFTPEQSGLRTIRLLCTIQTNPNNMSIYMPYRATVSNNVILCRRKPENLQHVVVKSEPPFGSHNKRNNNNNNNKNMIIILQHNSANKMADPQIWHYQVASVAAGFFQRLTLHPLDTVKTRLQYFRSRAKVAKISPWASIVKFISREGVPGLYRGILTSIIGAIPYSLVYMPAYEILKKHLKNQIQLSQNLIQVIAGAGAGLVGSIVRVPMDTIRKRVQVGLYDNAFASIQSLFGENGIKTLLPTWRAAIAYDVPYAIVQFFVLEKIKNQARKIKGSDLDDWNNVLVGAITGCITSVVTEPLDVIKTRMMTQTSVKTTTSSTVLYKGWADALVKIVREEGVPALWKGTLPRLVWAGLGSAIWFGTYEFVRIQLKRTHSELALKATSVHESVDIYRNIPIPKITVSRHRKNSRFPPGSLAFINLNMLRMSL